MAQIIHCECLFTLAWPLKEEQLLSFFVSKSTQNIATSIDKQDKYTHQGL